MRILITASAEADLQALYDQRMLQRGADGPDGAEALLALIDQAIANLTDFPFKGPIPPELEPLGISDWRQWSVWPYRIIYTVTDDALTVALVADSRRDFVALLERRILSGSLR